MRWYHGAGIFLLSMATLLLELTLTRVLSVALWYHFGFLIVSTALLGFGASGALLACWRRLREEAALDRALGGLAALFGLTAVGSFWLMQRIPFDPLGILGDHRQFLFIPLYYVVASAPFFFSGLALALLFTRATAQASRLYALDLAGAGLGCAAVALVMPSCGGSGSVVVSAALGMFAAATFAVGRHRAMAGGCLLLGLAACGVATRAEEVLPIALAPVKVKLPFPPIYTAWNTFSRIDVYERPAGPTPGEPSPRRIFIDAGTAATGLQSLKPDVRTYLERHPDEKEYPAGIAFVGKRAPRVLVIGSGAGEEVLAALRFGASTVTAVEINPIITDLVSHRMSDHWGGLFSQPEVRLVTDEGRSFVRRSKERYDAIISVHTISNAAVASGALSLAENYVLTLEAFEDYLDHLDADGIVYFTRPEPQIPRLVATAREALALRGVPDPAGHVYVYRVPPGAREAKWLGENRPAFDAGMLVKKSPFSHEEIGRIETLLGVGQAGPGAAPPAEDPAPERLYSPSDHAKGALYHSILTTADLPALYRTEARQIAPATDDRPFFNHLTRWSRIDGAMLRQLLTQQRSGTLILGDRPVAELSLLVLLAQIVLVAAAGILLPLARLRRSGIRPAIRWRALVYFSALGLGFILIEMALLSRFTLFLGQPVYTFAVVLASLLAWTGAGAFLSGSVPAAPRRIARVALPLLLLVLLATALALKPVFALALGLPLGLRVVVAIVLIGPLGLALGAPFPIGLRQLALEAPSLIPWAWGINAFATVIGTVLALMLAMTFGFMLVLMVSGLCYLAAFGAAASGRNEATPL